MSSTSSAVGARLSPLVFVPLAVIPSNLGHHRPPRSRVGPAAPADGADGAPGAPATHFPAPLAGLSDLIAFMGKREETRWMRGIVRTCSVRKDS